MRLSVLAVLCALGALTPARAEVRLGPIEWQEGVKAESRGARFEPVRALSLAGGKAARRLRAKISLLNGGPNAVEGILLRYCFSARLVPREGRSAGVWAVPFMIDEKRVPKLGAAKAQDVTLVPSLLASYLERLARTGFIPDRLRLQVMLEPRAGESTPLQNLESDLEVSR